MGGAEADLRPRHDYPSSSASTRRRTARACRCSSSARRAATGPAPTLLYGYGGFNISMTPGVQPGEHRLGRTGRRLSSSPTSAAAANMASRGTTPAGLPNKQNVFDDFIAAGEYLKANGIAAPQRPGDRRRLERRPAGRRGGQPAARPVRRGAPGGRRDGHAALRPVHRRPLLGRRLRLSRQGSRFPDAAGLFALSQHQGRQGTIRRCSATTADTDDRVVPGHSFKYIAALQATDGIGTRRTSSGSKPAPATARASRPPRSSRNIPTSMPSSAISPGWTWRPSRAEPRALSLRWRLTR